MYEYIVRKSHDVLYCVVLSRYACDTTWGKVSVVMHSRKHQVTVHDMAVPFATSAASGRTVFAGPLPPRSTRRRHLPQDPPGPRSRGLPRLRRRPGPKARERRRVPADSPLFPPASRLPERRRSGRNPQSRDSGLQRQTCRQTHTFSLVGGSLLCHERGRSTHPRPTASAEVQGFQGYDLSILRVRYLTPQTCFCLVFSCLAILRIEGCLNSTL